MKNRALLFDFDGVIADTEGEYSKFWEGIGLEILGQKHFGELIKGSTLTNILEKYFPGNAALKERIVAGIDELEGKLSY